MKLKTILLSFVVLFSIALSAQKSYSTANKKAIKLYDEALDQFQLRYFDNALSLLDKAIKKDVGFVEAYGVKGNILAQQKRYSEAIETIEKGVGLNPDFLPILYLDLGGLYFKTQQYDKGIERLSLYLNKYHPKSKLHKKAERILASCKFAIEAMKNPVDINPENLGPNVNSKDKDYLPVLSIDMNTLVFTRTIKDSRNPMGFQEDFFAAFKNGDKWRPAFNIGKPLNTEVNEGGHALTPDGHSMYFTICDQYGYYGPGRVGHGSCDIFVTKLRNGRWGEAKNLGPKVNHRKHDAQPSMSSDGKTLYFSSTRPGGYGENDIYVTQLTASGWTTPQNLGPVINTPGREEGVFIHPDNQTLYFSSDGHPGMGDNDIFMSKRGPDGKWGKPVNLGYPINTEKDEFDFTVDAIGEYAYMTSDREGGYGGWDIYRFKLPEKLKPSPVTYMAGKTFDAETNAPISAKFELKELEKGVKVVESTSNNQGAFLVCLPYGKEYALNAVREGYLFYSENFKLKESKSYKPVVKDVPMQPIKVGSKVVLKNIFFDTDKAELKSQSQVELEKLKEFLEKNPSLHIEISGHTDNVGSKEHNLLLSKKRANAVYIWLIQNKVSKERLSFKGYADEQPIDTNETEIGRAQNRRTEFLIVKK